MTEQHSDRNSNESDKFVRTVKDKCRVCYTCVRECPAKAIRIVEGQALVVPERCITCGNCVKVCSQGAKCFVRSNDQVMALLKGKQKVAACVAPSFPADFPDMDHRTFVGMIRRLGFDHVVEVGFGADLVAERYRSFLSEKGKERYIATTCPAIVSYVERYHPDSVKNLAPIVSPMIAVARALHKEYGDDLKIVFIGPCIAKKAEARNSQVEGEVDEVLTFKELKEMFSLLEITEDESTTSDFDPPHSGLGALFSLSRGMLHAANIAEDLVDDEVVTADGLNEFTAAIDDFEKGIMDARLLEVLSCKGCISGPGMVTRAPLFARRSRVSRYVRFRNSAVRQKLHLDDMNRFATLNLDRGFKKNDQRIATPSSREINEILQRLGKNTFADELNCGACGYPTCRAHAVAIHKGLAEDEMCLPYTIDLLKYTVNELSVSHSRLATTQDLLMQSEKLANMGQLAAGVAHELNNPLGVVLMYSHLILDEIDESNEYYKDIKLIAEQASRSKRIVSNLLDFARENKVLIEEVNIKDIIEKSVESVTIPKGVKVKLQFKHAEPVCEMDPEQMIQVFTNLISNACAAMNDEGDLNIRSSDDAATVQFEFEDNGCGISEENKKKIFQPFFTTKKIGKGTGLGLSVSYGIVKMHRGQITVVSNTDKSKGPQGSTFYVSLPRKNAIE